MPRAPGHPAETVLPEDSPLVCLTVTKSIAKESTARSQREKRQAPMQSPILSRRTARKCISSRISLYPLSEQPVVMIEPGDFNRELYSRSLPEKIEARPAGRF